MEAFTRRCSLPGATILTRANLVSFKTINSSRIRCSGPPDLTRSSGSWVKYSRRRPSWFTKATLMVSLTFIKTYSRWIWPPKWITLLPLLIARASIHRLYQLARKKTGASVSILTLSTILRKERTIRGAAHGTWEPFNRRLPWATKSYWTRLTCQTTKNTSMLLSRSTCQSWRITRMQWLPSTSILAGISTQRYLRTRMTSTITSLSTILIMLYTTERIKSRTWKKSHSLSSV